MKLVLVAIAALATACSIHHRSDQYTCTTNADCSGGRRCSADGYCVIGESQPIDAGRPDAPKHDVDAANNCPPGCTTCNTAERTCTIDCQLTDCTDTIICPPGYRCEIQCNEDNTCRNGINCQQAAACNIECSGKNTCEGIACGPGPCDVGCSGPMSCRDIACNDSCACDVACTGMQSCSNNIRCSSFACRTPLGRGCTSMPEFCHSCDEN